jgi:diguanylate cyclase (GGDEF)-like protein
MSPQEADQLIDTLAGVLRDFGRLAFDLERQDARRTASLFDQWAQHVATLAPPPTGDKAVAGRQLAQLRQSFTTHRKAEQAEMTQAQDALRDIVWAFVASLNRVVVDDERDDQQVGLMMSNLSQALQQAPPSDLRKLAWDAVEQVQAVLTVRRERQVKQVQSLAQKLETLGTQLEVARRESTTDPLTQLFNRRAFDEQLVRTSEFAQLRSGGAVLLMLDIDHFKKVNDTWGHPAGDEVLKAVAGHCVRVFKSKGDFVARCGGEELALLLPGASLELARALAEKLRALIYQSPVRTGDAVISVTVSIGVAAWMLREPPGDWLARADAALYRAKHHGRNRVEA